MCSGWRRSFEIEQTLLDLRPVRGESSLGAAGGTRGTYSTGTYAYSANGNITSMPGVGSYAYNVYATGCAYNANGPKPHAVSAAGSYGYDYDCNGNTTHRVIGGTTYQFAYDAENRMTGVSNGATATFVCDGDGNRVKATVGGVTTVYIGAHYERNSGTGLAKKYYYAGSQRVAMRDNTTLYFLLGDHLGSTNKTATAAGAYYGEEHYMPFGGSRYSAGTTPTSFQYTGQREESGLGGLYFYNDGWMHPLIGRFAAADTIVPKAGNPQSLNRYTYSLSNPLKYIDPSGHDPLDAEWVRAFTDAHGRAPTDRDRQDRLYSLIYQGSGVGGIWTDDDWAWYSTHRDKLWDGVEQWRNDSQAAGLDRFQDHVSSLASHYTDDESDQFVRAFALMYGGIPYSVSWQAAAAIIGAGLRPLGHGLQEGMAGWSARYFDTDNPRQDQTHHYAGLFFMGYFGGETFGGIVNAIRDDNGSYYNNGDTVLGRLAIAHAADFRALNMTPGDLAGLLDDLRPAWRQNR